MGCVGGKPWRRTGRRSPPGPPQEEPPDPERSLYYPLYLDLDLERGPWDDDDFDVEEGKARGGSQG